MNFDGFVRVTELLWKIDRNGDQVVEYPARLRVRKHGQSRSKFVRNALTHLPTTVPAFADVGPATVDWATTCNVTADTINKAIVVTQLFGNPGETGPFMESFRAKNVPISDEDAQAFQATVDGRQVGTFGDIGCSCMQQGKHATTGKGGILVSDNEALTRRMYLSTNEEWGYDDAKPDHYFFAAAV